MQRRELGLHFEFEVQLHTIGKWLVDDSFAEGISLCL